MERREEKSLHVLMFPWLAFGHIFPYLELSRWMAVHGVRVSFLSTPLNIRRVKAVLEKEKQDEKWEGEINMVELPLPSVDGLPPGAESTADIATDQTPLLKKALDGLETPFKLLLQHLSPHYVIHDFAQHWIPGVAAELGITPLTFLVFSAACVGYLLGLGRRNYGGLTPGDLTLQPPGYPPCEVSLEPSEARDMMVLYKTGCNGDIEDVERAFRCLEGCRAVVIKACFEMEMEGNFIEYIERFTGKPVLPVGPLVSDPPKQSSESRCLRWLDRQAPSSVVFVSFGSECFLTEDQIRQLALGLEATQLPFLCALRFPKHGGTSSLPEGFENRTRDRGIVVIGEWVPQMHVLSHPSTGGFLTHCGWSSLMEAMRFGVPLIGLPMQLDQGINARLVAREWKAAVEICRGTDGSFSKDDICKAVRMALVAEEGSKVRLKVKEISSTVFGKPGFQQAYIQNFIGSLRQLVPRTAS